MARRRLNAVPANSGRVALYVRVSALMGRGGEDFHSPEVQLGGMRNLIAQEGLREAVVIDDDIDVSGQTFDRKGIARLRALIEARQIDIMAVYTLTRLGRNLSECLTFLKWLRDRGVRIISASEKIDDSPEGQFMVGMWLNMAELQGNQIGANWARVIARRAKALGIPAGNVNQGYVRGPDGRYAVDPILGPAVTAVFADYAKGLQVADIALTFGAARGTPIAKSRLKAMLRNPVYAGRVVVDSLTDGPIDVVGQYPPLVDQRTWDRVQRRMAADRTTPPRHLAPAYSLTGLGRCDGCGNNLQIWHSTEHGKDDPTRRLLCKRNKECRDCDGVGTPLYAPIEAAVLAEVRTYAERLRGNPRARATQLARAARAGADAPAIQRELDGTRRAIAKLTERWARGGVPDDAYEETLAQLTASRDAQAAQLDAAQEASEAPDPGQVVKLVDRMLQLWPEMTPAEQNRGLKAVLRSFTVRKGQGWREPEEQRIVGFEFRW